MVWNEPGIKTYTSEPVHLLLLFFSSFQGTVKLLFSSHIYCQEVGTDNQKAWMEPACRTGVIFWRFAGQREGEHKVRGERGVQVTRGGFGIAPVPEPLFVPKGTSIERLFWIVCLLLG